MIIIEKNNNEKIYVETNDIEEIFRYDIQVEDIKQITIYAENLEIVNNFPFPESSYKVKINHCHLNQIPENLPTTIEKLDLSYNDFRDVNFQNFEQIKVLKMKNNRLISITLPPNLKELHINNNNLANLNNIHDSTRFINICNNLLISPLENINERCEVVSYNNLYSGGDFFIDYQVNIPFTPYLPPLNLPPNNFFVDIPPSNLNLSNNVNNENRDGNNLTEILHSENVPTNSQGEYQPLLDVNPINFNSFDNLDPLITFTFDPFPNEQEPDLEDTDFLEDEEIKNNYQEKINKINALIESKEIPVPDNFVCPISKCIFYNPVILSDGHTYEKMHILEWLKYNNKSPMTNKNLINHNISPNILIRSMVREWIDKIEKEFNIKYENENENKNKKEKKIKED